MKKTLEEIVSEIHINRAWAENFKKYIPLFIEEAKQGKPWQDWNKEVFNEFFEKSSNQCVSSLRNGYFSIEERNNIKDKWLELAPLLKQLADNQETPNYELYEQIRKLILTCTKNNKKAAIRRLIISLQPILLSTVLSNTYLYEIFGFLKSNIIGSDQLEYQTGNATTDNWFKNSHILFNFFRQQLSDKDPMDIVTYPWQTRVTFIENQNNGNNDTNDMSEKDFIDKAISLLKNKKQIILQGPPGTGKTFTAKEIAKRMIINEKNQENPQLQEQHKIIQFHPAYTYEDFVRGIVADSENSQLAYTVKNKTLMEFADKAYQNYLDSKKKPEEISKERRLDEQFNHFIDSLREQLEHSNKNQVTLTPSVYIFDIEEDALRYKGDEWKKHDKGLRMRFNDLKKAYLDNNRERQDIVKNENLSRLAKEHATYFIAVLNMFRAYLENDHKQHLNSLDSTKNVYLKNYVLIIDEINRANLPAVLGELIYALEYRGEKVDSIYPLDSNTTITLPPNLYIIGTMNTADRSIGQIDYAIRRRFAFLNLLPQPLEENFDKELFEQVSTLFIENLAEYDPDDFMTINRSEYLSEEFNPEDVWLGHSYFIINNIDERTTKLNYEIKPILKEYVKDGILKETALEIINKL